jgi:ATP-binding cassette subfamily F protein uup
VLDEPTNDLDIESLELLEATLQSYTGTLLVVSHDREFLDNVVTQTLVSEDNGVWREYAGGYSDWLVQRRPVERDQPTQRDTPKRGMASRERASKPKLTFKEARELEALPDEIEALEAEQHALTDRMCAPGYHQQPAETLRSDRERAQAIEHLLAEKFARWAELDAKSGAV